MPANLWAVCHMKFIENARAFALAAVALCGAIELEGAERQAAPKPLAFGKEQILVEAKFFEIGADLPAALAVLPWMKDSSGNAVQIFAAEPAAGLTAVLRGTKGADLLSAPSLTTRSGQQAVVEIIREVRYPIEWKQDAQAGGWKPTEHKTKNVGITLGVLAKVQNAEAIELTLRPEIVELVGFQDLDSEVARPEVAKGSSLQPAPTKEPVLRFWGANAAPAGRRARAHFAERMIEEVITVRPGESILLEVGTPTVRDGAKRRNFVLTTVKVVE